MAKKIKTKPRMIAMRPAVEGEAFWVEARHLTAPLIGSTKPGLCEVHPKGDGNEGQWICITCCKPLQNNWDKDSHCEEPAPRKNAMRGKTVNHADPAQPEARHVLAWRSFVSGRVEVP